ncbi:MAG: hypothetical protein WKF91_07295 [Segetibacter sp.]
MTKNINVTTNKNGKAAFRGFFGKYEIVVTKPDGTSRTFFAHLSENESNAWTFKF